MSKARILSGLIVGCLLAIGPLAAAPSVKQMLQFHPRQKGVPYNPPTGDELQGCEVKLVQGSRPGASAWLLVNAQKRPICRFFDSNGDKKIDIYSYFKDGVEIYREIDTNFNDRVDQYRWLNNGGMKWGIDVNEDGKIDAWKMISAEEAAQEVFEACLERDFSRLQALFISEAEIRSLGLPAARANQIRARQKAAPDKFQATLEKLANLNAKAQFVRVEGATPHCIPAESAGTDDDILLFPSRAIMYKGSDQKHDWLQTGEMIKVGPAWRLLDAPGFQEGPGDGGVASSTGKTGPEDPALQKLYEQLHAMDAKVPTPPQNPGPHPSTVAYNLERVALLEKILPMVKGERDTWIKQIFDNLSTAAQYSEANDKRAINRLIELKDQVVKDQAGSNLAAYGTFRLLWAQYTVADPKMGGAKKTQEEWLENLSKFVQTYPRAEDTPDALFHLGMGCEFAGKDEEAKRWYHQLHSHFADHPLAAKAKGCEDRLNLIGHELSLSGPMLSGGSMFDISRLKGKVVAVYYWASYCSNCMTDFPRLKKIHDDYASKGVELVLVNLDDSAENANRYLQSNPAPGVHLFQAAKEGGGMNSPLAIQYGIQSLPTLILIGRDGKVLQRTLQASDLEEAIKKAL